jgi:hypothetical protein
VGLFYFDLNLKLYLKRFEKKQKKKKQLTFLARRPSDGLLSRACPRGPSSAVASRPSSRAQQPSQPSQPRASPFLQSLMGGPQVAAASSSSGRNRDGHELCLNRIKSRIFVSYPKSTR